MRFEYFPYEGSWLPIIPVIFQQKNNQLPPLLALVDTGATHTILPMEMASELGIVVNLEDHIETQVAGGGRCSIFPSPAAITHIIRDPKNRREYQWLAPVFFTLGQQTVLLGHHRCLEKFDLTFKGPEKYVNLVPRFLMKKQVAKQRDVHRRGKIE